MGKSSFINKLLGQKISIVSDKPQTTRTKITGVYTKNEMQLVFIDTPGFHKARNTLGDNMVKTVKNSLTDIDAAILIIDACPDFKLGEGEIPPAEEELIKKLKQKNIKTILGINKIDLVKNKEDILGIITKYMNLYDFSAIVPFSAKTGDGVNALLDEASKFAHKSVHYFADDEITDQPDKVMVA